jgi:hypothetical protein
LKGKSVDAYPLPVQRPARASFRIPLSPFNPANRRSNSVAYDRIGPVTIVAIVIVAETKL